MSRLSRAGRRIARLRGSVLSSERVGREAVRIDDLISPLRYDVLVREQFFELLAEAGAAGRRDLAGLIERATGGPYYLWFRAVAVPRFRPELVGDEQAFAAAFAERVEHAVLLYESFEASGYDPGEAIVLRTGRTILPTTTGKRLQRRLYAGDGCHRLALLRLSGAETLAPGTYRVRSSRRLAPLDNTAWLLRLLGIELSEYLAFLALSYAPGLRPKTRDELLDYVRANAPERLAELERVLAVDLPPPEPQVVGPGGR